MDNIIKILQAVLRYIGEKCSHLAKPVEKRHYEYS